MLKTRNYFLLMLLMGGLIFSLASCSDDDDGGNPTPTPGDPTITVSPTSVEALPGETVDFTVTASAATGASVASVTANDGSGESAVSGNAFSFDVPSDATVGSTITITFTATDDQSPAKTASTTASITVSEEPGQEITVTGVSESTTWEAKNTYLLDGLVYVENNAVLTIEAGTTIKALAEPTTGDNTSSLIITRGAKIIAEGTQSDPIVMTTDQDPGLLNPDTDNALWGGLIVLGNAPMFDDGNTEQQVEGIEGVEPRAVFGGDDPDDDSGIIKYVSIRFTGAELAPGDELQGLTLGAVGAGTTIDFVEVFGSSDDGIEFFGGTVSVTHAAIAFAEDDSFDWDIGWKGNGQFWFAIQKADLANHAGEWDGAIPDGANLFSNPSLYNATFIGSGVNSSNGKNSPALLMRDATAGTLANSIIADFNGKGIEVEDLPADKGVDATARLKNGELKILNNIWFTGGNAALDASANGVIQVTTDGDTGDIIAEDANATDLAAHLTANMNVVVDPAFGGISRTDDGGLNPVPSAAEVTADLADFPDDLETVNYKGAFDPGANTTWLSGWTFLSQQGYVSE